MARLRSKSTSAYSGPVEQNIESVANMEQSFEQDKSLSDRIADAVGSFSGTLTFVCLHVVIFSLWFLVNTGHIRWIPVFDRYPFILLSMVLSMEAVLLSTFVLMKQNQMQRRSEHRDQVNLQIDLLSEQEITKALQLLQLVCTKLQIEQAKTDPELEEMAENTSVDQLARRIKAELPAK